jgi:hypothetical protein
LSIRSVDILRKEILKKLVNFLHTLGVGFALFRCLLDAILESIRDPKQKKARNNRGK